MNQCKDRFKFRIWDLEQKKFFSYDDFRKFDVEFNFDPTTNEVVCEYDKKRYVVIQSTGLKDKNGKLIFEGDILKGRKSKTCSPHSSRMIDKIGVVEIPDDMFIASCRDTVNNCTLFCQCEWNNTEVIGSILENPELIGGAE